MISSPISGMQSTGSASNKPDPCKEVCDINVKIADLGNACWTVSIPFEVLFLLYSVFSRLLLVEPLSSLHSGHMFDYR